MESFKSPEKNYEYYTDKDEREHIYTYCKELSNYLHNEKIPNIMFLDRSPRQLWVGLDEYWKNNYKNEERPGIFFVNPDGFSAKQDNEYEKEAFMSQLMFALTGKFIPVEKTKQEDDPNLKKDFEQAYKKLEGQKDQPLVVYDNCIHDGDTMLPVLRYLASNGYKDLRIVVGDQRYDNSSVRIDKSFDSETKMVICHPFDTHGSGVKKESNKIFSEYDEDADRNKVIKSREEVRRIVREQGK